MHAVLIDLIIQIRWVPGFQYTCECIRFNYNHLFVSCLGLGKTAPDPTAIASLDGADVPLGKGIPSGISNTCLMYNEYPLINIGTEYK